MDANRMGRAQTGRETVEVVERGSYVARSGRTVSIAAEVAHATSHTIALATGATFTRPQLRATRFEVTLETTARATQRLVVDEREPSEHTASLNFASAKNPGSGFLSGARAQEEDLARRSALYACQLTQKAHYDANRAHGTPVYTDSLLWSPLVPFFRDDRLVFVEQPWLVGVLTAPAPNMGAMLKRDATSRPVVEAALARRAAYVLQAFAHFDQRNIVLGAWGCGVFMNDPAFVASAFGNLLDGEFKGVFARVVFAIYDASVEKSTLRAFEQRFAGAS
jgi:uncharacterized protein (TIGR02452 family)